MSVKLPKYEDMQALSEREQEQAWAQALDHARLGSNQSLDELKAQIYAYEKKYGVSTEEMLLSLCNGKNHENDEFAKWQRIYWALSMLQGGHAR